MKRLKATLRGQPISVAGSFVLVLLLAGVLALTVATMVWAQAPGDSDGDGRCTEVDALTALQMAAGRLAPDAASMDVDGDGRVAEVDALSILQWAASGGTCQGGPPAQPPTQPPSQPPSQPPAGGPQLTALEPRSVAVGDQVTVRGTDLGSAGVLTLNSLPMEDADVLSWNDSEIVFRVPVAAVSGGVRAVVGDLASNALHLDIFSSYTRYQATDVFTDTFGIRRVAAQMMLGFKSATDQAVIDQAIADVGGRVLGYDSRLDVYQIEIGGADQARVDQAVRDLSARPEVDLVEPREFVGSIGIVPDDTLYPPGSWAADSTEERGWGKRFMRLPEAWDMTQGSNAVRLAVVDNGFMLNHPDLAPNILPTDPATNKTSWLWNKSQLEWELQKHGTHVAGIAGAAGNNGQGVTGVNWRTGLLLYDWDFGEDEDGFQWSDASQRFVQAMDDGARVINLSGGISWRTVKKDLLQKEKRKYPIPGDLDNDEDKQRIATAESWAKKILGYAAQNNIDVLVVIAAGNDALPATYNGTARAATEYPNLLTVASIDMSPSPGIRSDFSNHGNLVNIAAPGRDIWSTVPDGTGPNDALVASYEPMNGTSMAAPAVAGLAALTWAMKPELSAVQVKDCIIAGAKTRGQAVGEVHNTSFGPHGFYAVDAVETLKTCQAVTVQPQPPMLPVPPWKQQAVRDCIDRWLKLITDYLDRTKPGLAPHRVDEYAHLWNRAVIWAGPPDDWHSRWEGDRYKRIWYAWRPPPGSGIPPVQSYCGGEVDMTPVPVQPPPGPAPGAEPWNDPAIQQCIERWMVEVKSCADRTYPDNAPHVWSQWGLLLNNHSRQDQPPDEWGTRYEGNKYKWLWLVSDAHEPCPGVRSVQDYCSGASSAPGQPPPTTPGQPPPDTPGQPPDTPGQSPPDTPGQPPSGGVAHSRLFSIDNSSSMSGSKIEDAITAALNTVNSLPQGTEMALQFFGTSGCEVEMVLDFTTDRAAMSEAIKTAAARGYTPLAKAIEEAGSYMKAHARSGDQAIILLTDGEESCDGDPVAAARAINLQLPSSSLTPENAVVQGGRLPGLLAPAQGQRSQTSPGIRLHVIGFDVPAGSDTEQQLQEIATAGTGRYYPAGTEVQLTQALTQAATQTTVVKGDADGDGRCTEVDALAALRMSAGIDAPNLALDLDGDGSVTETDGLTILQWAAAGGQCGP